MAKEKIINPTVAVDPDVLLDELIRPACRYSIDSQKHMSRYARDFWKIIAANRDKFNEEGLQSLAKDILSDVSLHMRRYCNIDCNIDVVGRGASPIRNDAYTLLAGYLEEHPGTDLYNTKFTIDCASAEVSAELLKEATDGCFTCYDPDLPEWIMLAKFIIGPSHKVTFNYGQVECSRECIQVPDWDNKRSWHIAYAPVNNLWYNFVPKEWITKIEEIWN